MSLGSRVGQALAGKKSDGPLWTVSAEDLKRYYSTNFEEKYPKDQVLQHEMKLYKGEISYTQFLREIWYATVRDSERMFTHPVDALLDDIFGRKRGY
jgi:hypothetical protein